jgi:hypothetical protein
MRKFQSFILKVTLFSLLFSTLINAAHYAEHHTSEAHTECNICIFEENSDDISLLTSFTFCVLCPSNSLQVNKKHYTNFYSNFKKARSPPLS